MGGSGSRQEGGSLRIRVPEAPLATSLHLRPQLRMGSPSPSVTGSVNHSRPCPFRPVRRLRLLWSGTDGQEKGEGHDVSVAKESGKGEVTTGSHGSGPGRAPI